MRAASVLVACAAVAVASAVIRVPIHKRELTFEGVMSHAIRGEVTRRSVRAPAGWLARPPRQPCAPPSIGKGTTRGRCVGRVGACAHRRSATNQGP